MATTKKATRASGQTAAEEKAKEVGEKADELIEPEVLPEERKRVFRTPGFSRMTLNWQGDDRDVIKAAKDAVDGRIVEEFRDAYQVMHHVYDLVREPEVDEHGEVITDRFGFKVWRRTPEGDYEENWGRLTLAQRENLLFAITTRLFDWEQRAANIWGEAMFSKAKWEERFAIKYDEPMAGTIDDREAKGHIGSTEERYFAIYQSWASKKADAVVRTMSLLAQRLKDSLVASS